jgi:plasmid stabilization system protein ParE
VPHAITIFPRATADIGGAVTWRSQRSSLDGARLHAGLLAAIRTLANRPDRCPLADEAADLGLELRELLYGRRQTMYRVLFTITGQTVNVLRVRHAAQDRLKPGDV